MVNTSEGWVEAGSCDSKDSGKVVSASKDEITGIKFQFEKGMTVKVSEVHFDGVDAKVKHHKRILVMAPHEDDEMLMAGGCCKWRRSLRCICNKRRLQWCRPW